MIDLPIISTEAEAYFRRCGVPAHLIQLRYNDLLLSITDIVIKDNSGGIIRRVPIERQLKLLQRTMAGDFNNWLFCITGKSHPRRAQLMALYLLHAFAVSNNGLPRQLPMWHRVIGGFNVVDKLRDQEEAQALPLLILDGINIDSGQVKTEKVYDILEMYHGIPRIIIGSGSNPIDLMKKIHLPTNRVVYFDDDPIIAEVIA